MLRKTGLVALAVVLLFGAFPIFAQQNPMARTTDVWRGGCVACHNQQVMGQTLNVMLARDDHPNIDRAVTEIPNGCTMCHKDGALAPLVHSKHYRTGTAESTPVIPCLACHRMDARSGMPVNKNAPKNW